MLDRLTFAPCSANAMATLAPIPLNFPEPVTMAVLPFRDVEDMFGGECWWLVIGDLV